MKDEILTSAMNCTEAHGNTSDFLQPGNTGFVTLL